MGNNIQPSINDYFSKDDIEKIMDNINKPVSFAEQYKRSQELNNKADLERAVATPPDTEPSNCTIYGVSNSPMTSHERHQMYLHDEIEKMLSSKSYTTEELELIHKVIKNSDNFIAVIKAIKDCC